MIRHTVSAFFSCVLLLFVTDAYAQETRPFYMGFTRWPSEMNEQGIKTADDFIAAHADMISLHLDNGVPWQEALDGAPFPKAVMDTISYRPAGKKLYVAITPLNMWRDNMTLNWGDAVNQPLPANWQNLSLDDPKVIKAYTNFALRVVEITKPDYLAIGVEVNELITKNPALWPGYAKLHQATYQALKAKYPTLPVFCTFSVMYWQGLTKDAAKETQDAKIAALMPYNDVVGLSFYPHMSYDAPDPLPDDFFSFATAFNKPVAMTETGDTSETVLIGMFPLFGSEEGQKEYYEFLFKTALRDKYLFVITFATTDFEKLVDALPDPLDDIASIWKYTGLQTSEKVAKPALEVWDAMFVRPYAR